MRNSYNFYKKQLEGKYVVIFDRIELYCMTTSMDIETQKELLMELLDVFLTAQKQGRTVDRIVGSDVERFCKNFCSGIGLRHQLKGVADSLKRISWLVLLFCLFDLFALSNDTPFMKIQSDMMPILIGALLGIIISFLLASVFKTLMFRFKKINMRMFNVTVLLGMVAACGSCILLVGKLYLNVYDWVLVLITAVYLVLYYVVRRMFFPELKKPEKIRFTDKIIEEMPGAWNKRMEKKNERLIKKGKEPMTALVFTQRLQKEHRFDKWICIGGWVSMIVLYVGFGIAVRMSSEPLNTLIFLIILAVVYIPIIFWFRGNDRLTMWQKNTLDACGEQGIDLFRYLEQQKLSAKSDEKLGELQRGEL